MADPLVGESTDPGVAAVHGTHKKGEGGPAAIIGESEGRGVLGVSGIGQGVWGQSGSSTGVVGISKTSIGTSGESDASTGVVGISKTGIGLHASTETGEAAIRGDHKGGGFAGFFNGKVGVNLDLNVNGNVNVMGDVQLVGADLAEEFGVVGDDGVEPGCVVVLAGDDTVRVSDQPYDRRVAGVVSGAGSYRPGLVLDRQAGAHRLPLALTGKVWCKVDADCSPVELGDMLTTSPTPGHAMRASDPARAFGAVIGKALGSLHSGRGLVPVLVALQ